MDDSFGRVVSLSNVVFTGDGKHQVDSKLFRRRPCVIIGDNGDEYFILPLSSNESISDKKFCFILEDNKVIEHNSLDHNSRGVSYIKISNLFKRDICYYKDCGVIKDGCYIALLYMIKNNIEELRNNPLNGDIYSEFEPELDRQIKVLKRRRDEIKKG